MCKVGLYLKSKIFKITNSTLTDDYYPKTWHKTKQSKHFMKKTKKTHQVIIALLNGRKHAV